MGYFLSAVLFLMLGKIYQVCYKYMSIVCPYIGTIFSVALGVGDFSGRHILLN